MFKWLDRLIYRAGMDPYFFLNAAPILILLHPLILLRLIWREYEEK